MLGKKWVGLLVLVLVFGIMAVGCPYGNNVTTGNNGKTPQTFDPPQNIRVERRSSYVDLFWSGIPAVYSYEIYYGLSPDDLSFYIEKNYDNSYSFSSLDIGKIYYFAVKAKYSTGTSDFSQIVSCFTYPSDNYIHTIYEEGKYTNTSSNYFKDVNAGSSYWFRIFVLADQTATFYFSSDRYSTSYSLATISSQICYTADGTVISAGYESGGYKSPKGQYLYAKITISGSGQIKAYYSVK